MFKRVVLISSVITALLLGAFFIWLDSTPPSVKDTAPKDVIAVTHLSKDGIQRYVGEIVLPHSCFTITQDLKRDPLDEGRGTIAIQTTDKLLEMRVCSSIPTQYPFDVVGEYDKPINVRLTVDGIERPIVLRERPWQSARGTVVKDPLNTSEQHISE